MFKGRFSTDGKGFVFSDFYKKLLKKYMKENLGQPFEISPILIESKKQRGYFEASICPLVAFYHEGLDHHDSKDIKKVREWLKMEFNSEIVGLFNKTHRVAKSTKNELSKGLLERVVAYIEENYAPPVEALNPKSYIHWRDTVFPYGGPDNYIDYLLEINILENMENKETKELEDLREGPNYELANNEE